MAKILLEMNSKMKSLPTLFRNLKFYNYAPHSFANSRTFFTKFKAVPKMTLDYKRHNVSFEMKELGEEVNYINKLEREHSDQLQLQCMLALVDSIILDPDHQFEKDILSHIIGIYHNYFRYFYLFNELFLNL